MARPGVASFTLFLLLAGISPSHASISIANSDESEALQKNPIRRVVAMLKNILAKIDKEGDEEKALYDKFMCYCKTSGGDLAAQIATSTAEAPELQKSIEASEGLLAQLQEDVKTAQADRAAAKEAIDAATAVREKEKAEFDKAAGDYKSYLSALAKAIPAIMNGMTGMALVQSESGTALKQAVISDASISDYDRQLVTSFLAGGSSDGSSSSYVPASGEVLGILKGMQKDFQGTLDELTATETSAAKTFEELMGAKEKEISALTETITIKTKRIGETQVEIVNMKGDLTETAKKLGEDKKFLAELETSCATKTKEYDERVKTRAEETLAVHETIEVLTTDDNLDVFKKTLPSSSLIQVPTSMDAAKAKARGLMQKMQSDLSLADHRQAVGFIAAALQGKKADFSKVVKMIEDMVGLLETEQMDDNTKKEYCNTQFSLMKSKVADHTRTIETLGLSIEESTEKIAALKAELKALAVGIQELDKSVTDATETRMAENREYKELIQSNMEAKEILAFAKNRLNKFYNPTMYEAPKEATSFMQISEHKFFSMDSNQAFRAPPPPPETWKEGYLKKSGESSTVVGYIDKLVAGLDKEMIEAKSDEEAAQKAYEDMMGDAAMKRAADIKATTAKAATKSDLEETVTTDTDTKAAESKQLAAAKQVTVELHSECDWLLENFALRMKARAEEKENLKTAKAVLLGADFSLAQNNGEQKKSAPALRGA